MSPLQGIDYPTTILGVPQHPVEIDLDGLDVTAGAHVVVYPISLAPAA